MKAKYFIVFVLLLFKINCFFAIQLENEQINQREQKLVLKRANKAYVEYKYLDAIDLYERYLLCDVGELYLLRSKLADCYYKVHDYENALRIYKFLYPYGSMGATRIERIRIAELNARNQDYKNAFKWLTGIEGYESKANAYNNISTLKQMKRDSLNWHLGLLYVNTINNEFSPYINDRTLYFTSDRLPLERLGKNDGVKSLYTRLWSVSLLDTQVRPVKMTDSFLLRMNTRFQMSNEDRFDTLTIDSDSMSFVDKLYKAGEVNSSVHLVKGVNKIRYNVGAISFDKHNHFYFSSNYPKSDKKGINRLLLMEGTLSRRGRVKIKALPFGNRNSNSVMHPAVNEDGTMLVFCSDKPGNFGKFDMYYSRRASYKEPWDSVKCFGANVNTAGNEVFPTITSNGYLYYSSDALPGLGCLDIYRIKLQDALDGKSEPEHMTYPINSSADDFGLTLDSTGLSGYFSSDRLKNNNDIYSFIYKEPIKMYSAEDRIVDIETKKPINEATLFLYNMHDRKVYVSKTDSVGKYHIDIPEAKDGVIVKVVRKGYSSFFLPVSLGLISKLNNNKKTSKAQYFKQEELKINYTWKLGNIYYGFNSFELPVDAKPILDSLIHILKNYPITVEISSHTDSRGTIEYNQILSQRRSESVVNYLVEHGIDSSRLIAKGFGESVLINKCADGIRCTEKEYQENRRTEVKITDYEVKQASMSGDVDPDVFKQGDVLNRKALPEDFFNEP